MSTSLSSRSCHKQPAPPSTACFHRWSFQGRAERPFAVDEDIVLGGVVVPAMRENRAKATSPRVAATQEDIAEHLVTAVAIVKVNRRRAVTHGTADVAPEVVADDVAAARGGGSMAGLTRMCAGSLGTNVTPQTLCNR